MAARDRDERVQSLNAAACPVVNSLEQVGTQWRLHVVYALQDGELRFNELKRETGARSKTLSDALDALVEHGVVDRRMEEGSPVAVYYSLTEKGRELTDVLDAFGEWAEQWVDGVEAESGQFPTTVA